MVGRGVFGGVCSVCCRLNTRIVFVNCWPGMRGGVAMPTVVFFVLNLRLRRCVCKLRGFVLQIDAFANRCFIRLQN